MLKTYLMENYGYNEPIFLNDLTIQGLSENAVRQAVKRLVANGFLERYDNGIYYIPKRDGLLGKSYLRWLLCANIYKVNQRFMGMSQENHLPIS